MQDQLYRMTRFLVVALMTGAIAVACSSDVTDTPDPPDPPPAMEPPEENVVELLGDSFDPSLDTVAVNTTIEWRNTSGIGHTLTSDGDEWPEQPVPEDNTWTYTHTFDAAGTYDYECLIHSGMTGRIVVE